AEFSLRSRQRRWPGADARRCNAHFRCYARTGHPARGNGAWGPEISCRHRRIPWLARGVVQLVRRITSRFSDRLGYACGRKTCLVSQTTLWTLSRIRRADLDVFWQNRSALVRNAAQPIVRLRGQPYVQRTRALEVDDTKSGTSTVRNGLSFRAVDWFLQLRPHDGQTSEGSRPDFR